MEMYVNNASTLGRMELNISQSSVDILHSKTVIEYFSGLLVLLMHLGFTLMEAGSVRIKHTSSVFVRNLTSLIISVLIYRILGYAFSFGQGHFFIGYSNFGLYHLDQEFSHWFLHSMVASIPPVIVGGALAERCHFTGLITFTAVMSSFIYPLVVHWAWALDGWLSVNGFVDVGGAGCLHLVSGVAALTGVCIIGRRDELEKGIEGHSLPMAATGGAFVIVGMVGKEVGLAVSGMVELTASSDDSVGVIGRAAMSCLLGGAAGGLVGVVAWKAWRKKWSYYSCLNGWLAGMVAVSAGGHLLVASNSWATLVVGLVGGILYIFSICVIHASVLQTSVDEYLEDNEKTNKLDLVDDPVRAISVHLLPGVWGLISVPLLTYKGLLGNETSVSNSGLLFLWQVGGAGAMGAWTLLFTAIAMYPLLPMGKLRISPEDEKEGTDIRKIEESAYAVSSEAVADLNKSNLQKSYLNTRSKEFFKSTETLYASSQKLSGSSKILAPKIVIHNPTVPPMKETILSQSTSPLYQPKDESVNQAPTPPPMPSYLSMPNLNQEERGHKNGGSANQVSTLQVPVNRKYESNSKEAPRNNIEAKLLNKESRPGPLVEETKSDFAAELTVIQLQKEELKKQRKKLRPISNSNTWTSPSLLQRGKNNLDSSLGGLSSSSEGANEAKVEKAIRNTQSFNYLHPVKTLTGAQNCDTLDDEKRDVVFIGDNALLEETEDVINKIGELTLQESPEDNREMRLSSAATPAKNLFKEITNHGDENFII